ncbi:Cro/CI family transcriptional regulator [Amantichitinum ursilacus]|uniref:Cro/CI family transcriptional regulator n=1 Tax=Amantichitinum ursilacus TaxID=857265 RepID=UPI0006B426BB
MKPQTLIALIGSTSKLAAALGVTPGAVSQWVKKDQIPALRMYQLREMRPDLFVEAEPASADRRSGDDRRIKDRRASK